MDAIAGDLQALGLQEDSVKRLLEVMALRDMDGVEGVLGKESPAVEQVSPLEGAEEKSRLFVFFYRDRRYVHHVLMCILRNTQSQNNAFVGSVL